MVQSVESVTSAQVMILLSGDPALHWAGIEVILFRLWITGIKGHVKEQRWGVGSYNSLAYFAEAVGRLM